MSDRNVVVRFRLPTLRQVCLAALIGVEVGILFKMTGVW